jgi:hypothetical protein
MAKISKEEIQKDLNKYKAIVAMTNQEGGQMLVKLLLSDIETSIDTIAGNYKTFSHTDFIAQACRLHERLTMYRLITGAKHNLKIVEDALKEEEDTD